MSTYDPWVIDPNDFPYDGQISDQSEFLLRYAILAANAHNVQPWLFKIQQDKIYFYVDLDKRLKVADPDNRELYISIGCALTNFVIAARHCGLIPDITYLFDNNLVAVVTLQKGARNEQALFPMLTQRFTDRTLYNNHEIEARVIEDLRSCCENGVQLILAQGEHKSLIARLVYEGDKVQFADKKYRAELSYWIKRGLAYKGFMGSLVSFLIKHFNVGSIVANKEKGLLSSAPFIGILCAKNDELSWVRVGQIYERIALTALLYGVRTHPMNQGLTEVARQQEVLRLILDAAHAPLFCFRLGYSKSAIKHSSRNQLDNFLL